MDMGANSTEKERLSLSLSSEGGERGRAGASVSAVLWWAFADVRRACACTRSY